MLLSPASSASRVGLQRRMPGQCPAHSLKMRYGLKRSVLLPLFMLGAMLEAAHAYTPYGSYTGWYSKAWPSTNRGRFASTNDWVSITNMRALYWTEYASVTCKYDSLQGGTKTNDMIPGWKAAGYVYGRFYFPQGYAVIDPSDSNLLFDAIGLDSSTGATSNRFNVTNTYFTSIKPVIGSTADAGSTNTTTKQTLVQVKETTNIWNIMLYEKRVAKSRPVTTNFILNAEDARAWDCYYAIRYIDALHGKVSAGITYLPFYYRSLRSNCHTYKRVVSNLLNGAEMDERWINCNALTNKYATYQQGVFPVWKPTNIVTAVSAPSNYFAWTPYRNIAGVGKGIPRVSTSTFEIVNAPGTNVVTNTATDYAGGTHNVTGTNGQKFSFIVTNQNIAVGKTSADYGWKYLDKIIGKLYAMGDVYIAGDSERVTFVPTNRYWYGVGTGTTWNATTSAVSSSWVGTNTLAGGVLSYFPLVSYQGTRVAASNYYAEAFRANIPCVMGIGNLGTPTNGRITIYVKPYTNWITFVDTYDRNGNTNLDANAWFAAYHSYTVNAKMFNSGAITSPPIGSATLTNIPTACDEPGAAPAGNKQRGYYIGEYDAGSDAYGVQMGYVLQMTQPWTNVLQ